MARKVERNPFTPFLNGFSFDQAFDGSVWELARGEDFAKSGSTVAKALREEYERRYGSLVLRQDGDTVTVQRVLGSSEQHN